VRAGHDYYGGSTGGWEALAVQMFYPNEINGCFAALPGPQLIQSVRAMNIYKDRTRITMKVNSNSRPTCLSKLSREISTRLKSGITTSLPLGDKDPEVANNGMSGKRYFHHKERMAIQKEFSTS